jgi:tetratricopeptide (TPR) repeat protein
MSIAQRLFQEAGNLRGVVLALNWFSHGRFYDLAAEGGYEMALALGKQALDLARQIESEQVLGDVIALQGSLALQAGNMPMVTLLLEDMEKAIKRLKEKGKRYEPERLLSRYSSTLSITGQFEAAMTAHLEYHALREELGLPLHYIGEFQYGTSFAHVGRFAEAKRIIEDNLARALARQDDWIVGLNSIILGMNLMATGELETAEQVLQTARQLQARLDNQMDMAGTLANLGLALCRLGRYQEAKAHLLASLELVVKGHAYFDDYDDRLSKHSDGNFPSAQHKFVRIFFDATGNLLEKKFGLKGDKS